MTQRDSRPVATFVVFAIMIIVLLSCVTGCSTTVPVTAKFPEPPKYGTTSCPQLQKLSNGAKLSDVASTVNINYSTYYECAIKIDAWNQWYQIQKSIFEGATK